MKKLFKKILESNIGPSVLRVSLSIVYLYFGISQLIRPETFIGWLPPEVALIPISPRSFVVLNGGFEVFFGTLLFLGLYRRLSAFLLGTHLMGITFTIGFTEIGMRDFGLAASTLAIVLISEDRFSLDQRFGAAGKSKEENSKDNHDE